MVLLCDGADGIAVASEKFLGTGLGRDKNKPSDFPARVVRVMDGDFEYVTVEFKVRIVLGNFQFVSNGVVQINQINFFLEAVTNRMLC